MASKKIKKALGTALLGFGAAKALDMLGAKNTAFKENNIDKGRGSALGQKYRSVKGTATKEATSKAVKLPMKKPIKSKGTIAGDYSGITDYMSKGGIKTVKARGGKMVNLKPTKLY